MSDIGDPASRSTDYKDPSRHQHPNPAAEQLIESRSPAAKNGFFRTWFATSADLRPTPHSDAVKWGIHWYTPVTLVLLFLLGIGSAMGHHFLFNFLHDSPAGDTGRQQWVSWIGSSFGFLTKVGFTSVLGISRTQWIWVTLRKKSLTLGGIDALFGVSSDPTLFVNMNMLRNAKFATFMAAMMWTFPLTAILSQGSMSVIIVPETSILNCTVPTLVFSFDQNSTAIPLLNSGAGEPIQEHSMGMWDVAVPPAGPGLVWSAIVGRVFTWSSYSGTIKRAPNLSPANNDNSSDITLSQICGDNCTYTVQFLGPALTCTNVSSWLDEDFQRNDPLDFMRGAEYRGEITEVNRMLLVGVNKTTLSIVQCQKSIVQYTVQQVIQDRLFDQPRILSVQQTQYTVPQTVPVYPDSTYLANEVLLENLYKTLSGEVVRNVPTTSQVTQTTFYDDAEKYPSDLGLLVEEMTHKMVVSLISFNYTTSDNFRGVLDVAALENTTCSITNGRTIYHYSPQTLVPVYSISAAAALWMALVGFVALARNGVASNRSVSAIIRTTRNPTLDDHIGGSCLGGDPMPKELQNLELQFGALRAGAVSTGRDTGKKISSFALGVKGEIDVIKRGGVYS